MADRIPEDLAKKRWMAITGVRLTGAGLVMLGVLMQANVIRAPLPLAYAMILFGLFDVFAMPVILARKWRTPPKGPIE